MDALRPVQGARRLVVEDNLINQQVPSELLVGFYQDHGEDIAAIREALSRGEENVAQRLAHIIKGVAATIGAADMTLRAKDLEAAIKGGQEAGCGELVEQLELAMQPVLQGLSGLAKDQEVAAAPNAEIDPAEVSSILDELEGLIEEMDPDSEEKAEALQRMLGGTGDRKLSAQLVQQVSGFEFDDALTTLANIRHSLETDR